MIDPMDDTQLKAIQDVLSRRTLANTETKQAAKEWILRDGVHRHDGFLLRAPLALPLPKKAP